jgi:hypothetical protein
MLKRKGTFVSLGNASGPVPPFSPLKLSAKNLKFCLPSCVRRYVQARMYSPGLTAGPSTTSSSPRR